MKIGFALAALAATAVGGCASPRLVGNQNLTIVNAGTMPAPTRADLTGQVRPAVIGPLDRISVDVFGLPELSRAVQADANGQISLPLAGTVDAAGNTPAELARLLEARLRGRYVRDPQVTVNIVEAVSQTVTVDGAVEEPGIYPVTGRMTLMRTVARAKGASEFARLSYVVVFRRVEGRQYATLYDLRAIRNGAYDDPEIYANDIVVVGTSQARRLFRDIIQGSGLLTAPLIAILQRP
ncbi:polysaccharide biosynthesis/export family protein [Allosphingosinicella sp.]|uniref:polysaccharide biosynthesis/export family protein n=1 Tax=Allosphingosinicella sp. TaxID=2823234 RepID=UPI0037843A91